MRKAAGLSLLLAACSPGSPSSQGSQGAVGNASDNRIDCAIGGAATFAHDCTVERSEQSGTRFLVVRHPDGGLRRFEVVDGGKSLAAADGAQAAAVANSGDRLDVSIDGDRYRIPAAMLSDEPRR
jgi:hypothetical protein